MSERVYGRANLLPFDKYVDLDGIGRDGVAMRYSVLWDGQSTLCKSCGANIGFGLTSKKKWVPFDLDGTGKVHFETCSKTKRASIVDPFA